MTSNVRRTQPLAMRLLRRLPVVGFAIHLLETENVLQIALLAANVVGYTFLGTALFGFSFLMPLLYAAVALATTAILLATRG